MAANKILQTLITILGFIILTVESKVTYKTIWRHLLADYDSRLRPVLNPSDVLTVATHLHVDHIIALDAKSQTLSLKIWFTMIWVDAFLKFNASEIGVNMIAANANDIWTPDIFLYQSLDEETGGLIANEKQGFPLVNSSGHVTWIPPVMTKSACRFDVRDYPFDVQTCNLTLSSWVYDIKSIRLTWDERYSYDDPPAHSGEWHIDPVHCEIHSEDFGTQFDKFDVIRCQLTLARKPLFYIINLVVPCLLLLLIGAATFFLPVNCEEKVSLSITILLAMTVFMLVLEENLPPTSDAVPFLGKFIVSSSIMLAMSTAMAVSIVNLSTRGISGVVSSPPPRWLTFFVINFLAKIVCFSPQLISKLKENKEGSMKNQETPLVIHRQDSEDSEIKISVENKPNKDNGTVSPNLVTNETSESNGGYEMWIVIAHVLDRIYLIIYSVMFVIVLIIASVMASKSFAL